MRLVVFDVDGVILDVETGGFMYLAKAIGKEKEVEKISEEYKRRKTTRPWGLEQLARLFEGTAYEGLKKIAYSFCRSYLMHGAEETIKTLKSKGYSIAFLSSNPLVIMEQLKEILGADLICGNKLELKNGICTGRLTRKVDRYVKAEELEKIIIKNSIPKSEVYVIGDSETDIPMARYGIFISYNSKDEEVDKLAEGRVIKEKDLRKTLKFIK